MLRKTLNLGPYFVIRKYFKCGITFWSDQKFRVLFNIWCITKHASKFKVDIPILDAFHSQSFGLHLNGANSFNFANPFKIKFKVWLNIGGAVVPVCVWHELDASAQPHSHDHRPDFMENSSTSPSSTLMDSAGMKHDHGPCELFQCR